MTGEHPIQFKPSLPEKNDNVSHNHPAKEFFILLCGIITIFLLLFWSLGLFVDLAVQYISPEKEAILFSKFQPDALEKNDPTANRQAYLQRLTDSLRKCLDVRFPVRVRLVDSVDANAFAFPGGTIVVFSGLINKIKSENGLSFVLAHELGHYKNRDHLRGLGRSIVFMALSSLLTGANSDITSALAPVQLFGQAQYSQSREKDADQTALTTLNCVYNHVGGAADFFHSLLSDKSVFDITALHYFSTHPELQRRIDTIYRLAEEQGFRFGTVQPLKKN